MRQVVQRDSLAERRKRRSLDVLRRDRRPTGERRERFRAQNQRLTRARPRAPLDVLLRRFDRRFRLRPRLANDVDRVFDDAARRRKQPALRRTEEAIQAALDEVKESRVRFRAASAEKMQAQPEVPAVEEEL